jgi:MFS family permease
MSELENDIRKHLKHNLTVNLLDGGFFGMGWGFGSLGTVVTLFVSRMTDSPLLIGLIPAIHAVGWQLPQLFMVNSLARLRHYKPLVLWLTIHERLPYLGLVFVALFLGSLGNRWALILVFFFLIWMGLGAGFTANPWQSLVAKIIPSTRRGTFFGAQAALSNILLSAGAIAAGFILEKVPEPQNFAICFALALVGMALSMLMIGLTREPTDHEKNISKTLPSPWKGGLEVLRKDRNFAAFVIIRLLSEFSVMSFVFYIIYGLQRFNMNEVTAGFLTAALSITQTLGNATMGWLGDRFGHRSMLIVGALSASLSSLLAWGAPSIAWMYPAFILCGLAGVGYWTNGIAITVEFGNEETRPTYIGLSNTLVAPLSIIGPLIGGWIAQTAGFQITFMISAVVGLIIAFLLYFFIRDPRPRKASLSKVTDVLPDG